MIGFLYLLTIPHYTMSLAQTVPHKDRKHMSTNHPSKVRQGRIPLHGDGLYAQTEKWASIWVGAPSIQASIPCDLLHNGFLPLLILHQHSQNGPPYPVIFCMMRFFLFSSLHSFPSLALIASVICGIGIGSLAPSYSSKKCRGACLSFMPGTTAFFDEFFEAAHLVLAKISFGEILGLACM